ncbi:hypothetical protein GGX14DRAFT_563794 [Mycena pura]|uniref:Uncharacterized protein n=1 Tax=Mycena pura TaxID=153505 RepID=A0AAD6VLJ8_9AGAR|nr:hypothetical protein GGX14DRAFT_563794 [Mycena pura]
MEAGGAAGAGGAAQQAGGGHAAGDDDDDGGRREGARLLLDANQTDSPFESRAPKMARPKTRAATIQFVVRRLGASSPEAAPEAARSQAARRRARQRRETRHRRRNSRQCLRSRPSWVAAVPRFIDSADADTSAPGGAELHRPPPPAADACLPTAMASASPRCRRCRHRHQPTSAHHPHRNQRYPPPCLSFISRFFVPARPPLQASRGTRARPAVFHTAPYSHFLSHIHREPGFPVPTPTSTPSVIVYLACSWPSTKCRALLERRRCCRDCCPWIPTDGMARTPGSVIAHGAHPPLRTDAPARPCDHPQKKSTALPRFPSYSHAHSPTRTSHLLPSTFHLPPSSPTFLTFHLPFHPTPMPDITCTPTRGRRPYGIAGTGTHRG